MPRSAFLTISFQMGLEEGGAIENSQWKWYDFHLKVLRLFESKCHSVSLHILWF